MSPTQCAVRSDWQRSRTELTTNSHGSEKEIPREITTFLKPLRQCIFHFVGDAASQVYVVEFQGYTFRIAAKLGIHAHVKLTRLKWAKLEL
jgi:hypothetical protein